MSLVIILLLILVLVADVVNSYNRIISNTYKHKHRILSLSSLSQSLSPLLLSLSSINDYEREEDIDDDRYINNKRPLKQLKLYFNCDDVDGEEISEFLFEIGVLSVSVEVQSEKSGVLNDERYAHSSTFIIILIIIIIIIHINIYINIHHHPLS